MNAKQPSSGLVDIHGRPLSGSRAGSRSPSPLPPPKENLEPAKRVTLPSPSPGLGRYMIQLARLRAGFLCSAFVWGKADVDRRATR